MMGDADTLSDVDAGTAAIEAVFKDVRELSASMTEEDICAFLNERMLNCVGQAALMKDEDRSRPVRSAAYFLNAEALIGALREENARLSRLINTPETEDFIKAVPLEAAHQNERWGANHDDNKSPWDWFWTLGYLASKAAQAALANDTAKARHHTITVAALALNWHRRLSGWKPETPA